MTANRGRNLVVIASSTGGPKALHKLIPSLDKRIDAPVIVVQHMPGGFTYSLAERLNEASEVLVSEAVDGQVLEKGHVYIAKGGKHLQLKQNACGELLLAEDDSEPVNGLKPCANITFNSLVNLPVDNVISVVLTGMGSDGYEGIRDLRKKQSVYTIAQSRETCVVYGMPKTVVEKGVADVILPLEEIANEILKKTGVL